MTLQEALQRLGLSALPKSEQELVSAYKKEHSGLVGRFQTTPGTSGKDKCQEDLCLLKEARDVVSVAVGKPAAPPSVSYSAPRPPTHSNTPVRPSSSQQWKPPPSYTRKPWAGRLRTWAAAAGRGARIALRAAAQGFTKFPTEIQVLLTGLVVAVVLVLVGSCCVNNLNTKTNANVGANPHANAGIGEDASVNATAQVRFETWPAANVYVDGQRVGEAPSPRVHDIEPGEHTIRFKPKKGPHNYSFHTAFQAHQIYIYTVKMNQKSRTYTMERSSP